MHRFRLNTMKISESKVAAQAAQAAKAKLAFFDYMMSEKEFQESSREGPSAPGIKLSNMKVSEEARLAAKAQLTFFDSMMDKKNAAKTLSKP